MRILLSLLAALSLVQGAEKPVRSVEVYKSQDATIARSVDGATVRQGIAGKEDAAVLQAAVEAVFPGGKVHIRTGRYTLDRSIVVDGQTTIAGEGRHTVLVSPPGEFALRLAKTARSTTDRADTLTGVTVSDLTVHGERAGKGIYLSKVAQSALRNLWIYRTDGGAGLFFDQSVMEMQLSNLHLSATGNAEKKEASIVISNQVEGDANNNLHFQDVFVLGPNYIGVEIGAGTGKYPPRLLWFNHCMFHGWIPPKAAPFDLILVRRLESARGMVIRDSRITNSGEDSAYVNAAEGDVKLFGNIFGGGWGKYFIRGERTARLTVSGNSFHAVNNSPGKPNYAVHVEGSELTFRDNILHPKVGPVRLRDAVAAIVSDNRFRNAAEKPCVRIERSAAGVVVSGNYFYGVSPEESIERDPEGAGDPAVRDNIAVGAAATKR